MQKKCRPFDVTHPTVHVGAGASYAWKAQGESASPKFKSCKWKKISVENILHLRSLI